MVDRELKTGDMVKFIPHWADHYDIHDSFPLEGRCSTLGDHFYVLNRQFAVCRLDVELADGPW